MILFKDVFNFYPLFDKYDAIKTKTFNLRSWKEKDEKSYVFKINSLMSNLKNVVFSGNEKMMNFKFSINQEKEISIITLFEMAIGAFRELKGLASSNVEFGDYIKNFILYREVNLLKADFECSHLVLKLGNTILNIYLTLAVIEKIMTVIYKLCNDFADQVIKAGKNFDFSNNKIEDFIKLIKSSSTVTKLYQITCLDLIYQKIRDTHILAKSSSSAFLSFDEISQIVSQIV